MDVDLRRGFPICRLLILVFLFLKTCIWGNPDEPKELDRAINHIILARPYYQIWRPNITTISHDSVERYILLANKCRITLFAELRFPVKFQTSLV